MQQGDGWLADPTGRHELRYYAGGRWTDNVSDRGITSLDSSHGGDGPGPASEYGAGGVTGMQGQPSAVRQDAPPPAAPSGMPAPGQPPGHYGAVAPKARPIIGFAVTAVGV